MRESAVIVSLVPASLCTIVRGAGATSYRAKVERSHPSNSEATGVLAHANSKGALSALEVARKLLARHLCAY
eukprot:4915655-Amphidinium_carterae.1